MPIWPNLPYSERAQVLQIPLFLHQSLLQSLPHPLKKIRQILSYSRQKIRQIPRFHIQGLRKNRHQNLRQIQHQAK